MNQKYNLVDTLDKLRELDTILMDGDTPRYKILSFDTETNGLQLYKSTVVGFSISFNKYSGYYVPLLIWEPDESSRRERSYKKVKYSACMDGQFRCAWTGAKFHEFVTPQEYNIKERFPLIPALLERWLSKVKLYMWNAPFDVNHTFINTGIDTTESVLLDGGLMVHVLDENFSTALKANAEKYKGYLGINPHAHAAMEKKELDDSIIRNGGTPGQVWRAALEPQSKYACADTFFTFGICEAATVEFANKFGDAGLDWFFNKEVMPVCKEVVINMKRRGVYIDVPYFKNLFDENTIKMNSLEDQIINTLSEQNLLSDFDLGKNIDEAISEGRVIRKIIQLEGLKIPIKKNKDGNETESLAKSEVKKEFQKNPHWLWGYILGEDEIKYSTKKLNEIKQKLYEEVEGRRYRFNIGSKDHLTWLFCNKLGMDKRKLPQTDSATKENPIPSMAAEVLEEFMLPKFPWVATLMSYKKLQKLQSTYIAPALELNIDGWMYMDMKQNGTTSGRFSCSGGYNLQTLPRVDDEMEILEACDKCESKNVKIHQEIGCIADRECLDCKHVRKDIARPSAIKRGFIAPPGYKIVNADYSSLEPRCFAFMSGEQIIKDIYLKGLDMYSQFYCELFDDKKQYSADPKSPNFLKTVAPAKRKWIKPVVLAIPYGAEDYQVAALIGAEKEIPDKANGGTKKVPDVERGREVRDLYLSKLNKLNQYMDNQDLNAISKGYVETIIGRRRHLPYVKIINDILDSHGINYKDVTSAAPFQLKNRTSNFTSRQGIQINLPESVLIEIAQALNIRDDKLAEKENWSYIRNLLKADLNNAKNNPIQGLAGHITNKGMLVANRSFKEKELGAWVCLQVHDELTVYAPMNHADASADILKISMEKHEFASLMDIPLIAEPVVCDNLKESK